MKIPVIEVITHLALGGAQRVVLTLAEKLDRDKFELHIVSSEDGGFLKAAKNIDNCTFHPSKHLLRELSLQHDSKVVFELYSIFRKIKKQSGAKMAIVHTHAPKAGVAGRIAAKMAGCIPVHTLHGLPFNPLQGKKKQFAYKIFESFGYLFGKDVITVTEFGGRWLLENRLVKRENLHLIRPSVEMENLFALEKKRKLLPRFGVVDKDTVIGFVASLKPPKDPFTFLKAFKKVSQKLPQIKAVIVGDGIIRPEVETLISSLKLEKKVILTGWQTPVEPFYREFDLLVLTSDSEGLPLTLVEAMASKTPVIASNVGGISELIEDNRNGFLVGPKEVETLAERILDILKKSELRERFISEAGKNLQDYHHDTMVRSHEKLFAEIFERSAC